MALVTYPLNNIEYSAEDAELFHVTRTSGIYANDSFNYSVSGGDNTVVIGTGIGWIKNSEFSGKVIALKEAISLDMGLPDSVYPRIDSIVIQFDANKNETNIIAKQGTAASYPIAPSVIQTESVYELHLYHVHRKAGSIYITTDNITDLRLNNSYCGLMADSVTNIDKTIIDTTLSVSGQAADAKAAGDALSGKVSRAGDTMSGSLTVVDEEGTNEGFTVKRTNGSTVTKGDIVMSAANYTAVRYWEDGACLNGMMLKSGQTGFLKPVGIDSGGTGATTAAGAIAALGINQTAQVLWLGSVAAASGGTGVILRSPYGAGFKRILVVSTVNIGTIGPITGDGDYVDNGMTYTLYNKTVGLKFYNGTLTAVIGLK